MSPVRSCLHPLLAILCLSWNACGTYEEKRIRELQIEKGFGSRAEGEATLENYVAGGDVIRFIVSPMSYQDPAAAQLYELSFPQRPSIDGKITIPYVGRVFVLGKTEAELTTLVKSLLRPVFNFDVDLQAQIVVDSKNVYAFGETRLKGAINLWTQGGDWTVLKAVANIGWTQLANLGRVYLIRPDAEHPLVVEINVHRMITTGYTNMNLPVRENDIIYIPPTFLGLVARILEQLLAPVAVAVNAMLGIAEVRTAYEVAIGERDAYYFRF